MDKLDLTDTVTIFENTKIRRVWHNDEWYFSITDIVKALTDSTDPKQYLKKMRQRDSMLELNWGTICTPLQMQAQDQKMRDLNCTNTEGAFRLIQSIPSPKAEPFKLWLAKTGYERIEEMQDPELSFNRAMRTYLQKGYSREWINQRLKTIELRKELTDEWNRAGIDKESDFAILTNELTKVWSGKTVAEYKELKNLDKENLRDNMTSMESVLNMLAEAATTELSKKENPITFHETKQVVIKGGTVAGNTRKDIESQLGKSIISVKSAKENLLEPSSGSKPNRKKKE